MVAHTLCNDVGGSRGDVAEFPGIKELAAEESGELGLALAFTVGRTEGTQARFARISAIGCPDGVVLRI